MDPISVATALPPGYDFVRPLGSGGMGEVVLARRGETGELVAIKFLAPARPRSADTAGRRFAREARLMTSFDHPNVVRVLDSGRADGRDYLVMEYVDGPSLRGRLTPGKPVPPREARPLLAGLVAALEYLESQGVVHRDLKPENVLLPGVGDQGSGVRDGHAELSAPKVTDFGIAAETDDSSLTTTGEVLGTYDYMAPEQRARLPVDARADQYALAIIAYEMLTGRRPAGTYKSPSKLNPALGPGVDAALAKALQEDPDDRYPSAAAFHADLDRALAARPRRWPVGLAGVAAVAGLAFAAWALRPAMKGDDALAPAQVEPSDLSKAAVAIAPVPPAADPSPHLKRALEHKKRNEYEQALAELDAALVLVPGHVEALVGRGSALTNLQRYDAALADFDEAIRRDPRAAEAFAYRGWARTRLPTPDFDMALADLDEAVRLAPELAVAYNLRAMYWQGRKQPVKARDDYERAIRYDPDNAYYHGIAAQFYALNAQVRNPQKSLAYARRACELSEWKDWRQIRALGYAHAVNGQYAEAIEWCEKALPMVRDEKLAQDVRNQIENYRKRLPPKAKGGQP